MGARGGRLDGRHHRHPVADRERLAAGIRWIIRVPREFVNDYIFNFPDTSFAWAFVLALLAAALAARKRIAWWILVVYMVAAIGWNVGDLITGDESMMEDIGEVIGLAFHVAAIRSWCWPARSSGRRYAAARCSRRRPRWSRAWRSARSSAGRCSNCSLARWPARTGSCTR